MLLSLRLCHVSVSWMPLVPSRAHGEGSSNPDWPLLPHQCGLGSAGCLVYPAAPPRAQTHTG